MVQYVEDRPAQRLRGKSEHPEHHETEVADGGVGHEPQQVGAAERHEGGVEHGDS